MESQSQIQALIVPVCEFVIGWVFLLAAVNKLRAPTRFLVGVANYEILPPRASNALGVLIILAEFLAGLCQIALWHAKVAAAIGAGLLSMFGIAAVVVIAGRREIPCHCFSSKTDEIVSVRSLVRIAELAIGEIGIVALAPSDLKARTILLSSISNLHTATTALVPMVLLVISTGTWVLRLPALIAMLRMVQPFPYSGAAGGDR